MKRFLSFALALVMLVGSLVACGPDPCTHSDADGDGVCDKCSVSVPSSKIDYTVTVKDGGGEALKGVIVKIYAASDTDMEDELDMSATSKNGVASFKLEPSSYLVKLVNTKDEQLEYNNRAELSLSEAYPDLSVTVYDKLTDKVNSMYGDLYKLADGSYYTEFTSDSLTYFVFIPKRTGVYEISVSADTQVQVGKYGNPYNILEYDITEDDERVNMSTVKVIVNANNIGSGIGETTNYVIGIKGRNKAGSGAIIVKRTDDVQIIPENKAPIPENLPESDYRGGVPENIDITVSGFANKYAAVYNESDGYYHLCTNHTTDPDHICDPDGEVIYVRLASSDGYINFKEMIAAGNGISCYIYNALGEPLERKDYTEMVEAYIEKADATYGVYALTEQLREALQNYGEYVGWFDSNSQNYLFGDKMILSRYKGSEYLAFCCFG